MVWVPAVLKVKLKVPVPALKAAFVGSIAFASLDVMAIVGVVLTTFQLSSTAFTVTFKEVPAVWGVGGVPVLPVGVPGAAVSPGIRT
jgi:hypothetical protein